MENTNWATEEEYQAQLALPLHFMSVDPDLVRHATACGIKLPSDEVLRITDTPTEDEPVTCEKCLAAMK